MATQVAPLPDRLTITEDTFDQLRRLADSQRISISQALTQAVRVSDIVVRSINDPNSKVILKKGKRYEQLTLVPDED